VIVDTSALVAIATAEPGYERLLRTVAAAADPVLPASCLLEAHMVIRGRFPPAMVATLDRVVAETGLRIAAFTEAHATLARAAFDRYGKGRNPAGLNFGDCMAYAVAMAEGAPLLFTGEDFALTDMKAAGNGG
jgi:ribonuclease VapC